MADFLKFINELTVNGKPVDDDEEDKDDDYTADSEPDDDTPLDLEPGEPSEDNKEDNQDELIDDDDYTAQSDMDDTEDSTDPEGDTTGEEPTTDETPDDTGEELDLNPAPANDTTGEEPAADETPDDTAELDTDPDTTGDAETPDGAETTDDTTGEEPTATDDGDLDMGGAGEDDDYNAQSGEDGEEPTGDDLETSSDDSTESGEDSELEKKIKQTEAEVFNTLSDDEKAIKNKELIDNYISLKTITKVFLEKVQTITTTEENANILTFVEVSLLDLNKMITDYIITRYSKKSYIENFVTYQQFILTIEQLKDIITKLKPEEKPEK